MFRFDEKVCLITGTGNPKGIGFEAAKQIGGLGGKVLLLATTSRVHDRVEELKELGIQAEGYICNLCNREEVEETVQSILTKYKNIHVLVNNAGISSSADRMKSVTSPVHPKFADLTDEAWDNGIEKNLTLTYNITRKVLPSMIENGYGRIVHVSSVTGPVVTQKGLAAYSAAKAAIIGLSKAIALENGKYGITSNCVLPGWVDTGVLKGPGLAAAQSTPAGRAGSGAEIAAGITFLSSEEASYVTGQELIIDGGNVIQEVKGNVEVF